MEMANLIDHSESFSELLSFMTDFDWSTITNESINSTPFVQKNQRSSDCEGDPALCQQYSSTGGYLVDQSEEEREGLNKSWTRTYQALMVFAGVGLASTINTFF
tara:strand:- start:205 stop:516 length:312 start_codon:yes stop_codon:yes gene_type:complete